MDFDPVTLFLDFVIFALGALCGYAVGSRTAWLRCRDAVRQAFIIATAKLLQGKDKGNPPADPNV